ncbi:sigma-70 family RNA polymerase sigma factor [Calycomorphotria hydatis]|uniref:ECF RNA polymerase sigma factor SigW n=1 Tax=Calycomorphotria hydatis TaxID=2528027 RepID=A0A517TD65_9PLAN|nr:sigma-70 family RNA polymerase sigma factor [Calycomorphotria hydatis]QDT66309.1 ECF RNA polymerase sigma factor SigW [Calycomorphotria hydatis]
MEQQQSEQFVRLLTSHREQLYAYIYSLLANHADAEDVFQRCSLIMWKKFDQYDQEREFLPWASGVAFYEVKNFLRVSSRDRHYFSERLMGQLSDQMADQEANQNAYLKSLEQCLKSLPKKDRQLVEQVYWEKCDLPSLAEEMGIVIESLYNRMSRLRRRLMDCVSRRLQEGGSHV